MKVQACFLPEAPLQQYFQVFGPMAELEIGGVRVMLTSPFASVEHLRTLCGTFQGRMERAGRSFTGAVIQAHGDEPCVDPGQYPSASPLKVKMDYAPRPTYTPVLDDMVEDRRIGVATVLEHPDTIIVAANDMYPQGISEQQIVDYYNSVRTMMVREYQELNVESMTVLKVDDHPIVRRNSFDLQATRLNDETFDELNRGRTVEFHYVLGSTTRLVWIDIDPKPEFPFEDARFIALDLQDAMQAVLQNGRLAGSKTEIRFSGKKGFHVLHYLRNEMATDEAREDIKSFVRGYIDRAKRFQGEERLTDKFTDDPKQARLDYSTLHESGGIRASYSLAFPTGLICLPMSTDQAKMFAKEQATMSNVLSAIKLSGSEVADLRVRAELKENVDWALMFSNWIRESKLPEDLNEPMQAWKTVSEGGAAGNVGLKKLTDYLNLTLQDSLDLIGGHLSEDKVKDILISMMEAAKKKGLDNKAMVFEAELTEYKQKRQFDVTSEPSGAEPTDTQPSFVVQQHDAQRAGLHYDFRLAYEGVLKSWAVPHLPEILSGAKDQVLAIEVEDHPVEYGSFEGSIPAGQYGGGQVKIWDTGNYETVAQDDDHWKFNLQGSRLQGTFALIRTAGKRWLMRRIHNARQG